MNHYLFSRKKCISYLHIGARYCSNALVKPAVLKPATSYKTNRIVDKVRVYVRGGSGGQGCPSAGGIGGIGGSVFVKCMKGASLRPYTFKSNRRIIAEHGEHYQKGKMKMKPGRNAFIVVPPGTQIKSVENKLITDLNSEGDIVKVAKGGNGGSSKTYAFNGMKGQRQNITLEFKTIADVALTGFPNAGKSSLLRALSRARPKVGEYPFTTFSPTVGSVFYTDDRQSKSGLCLKRGNPTFVLRALDVLIRKLPFQRLVSVADLPGLIEEARLNKGMGHRFLRHIEKTSVILMVVDVNGFQLKSTHPYRSPMETVVLLLQELLLYQDILLERPIYLVINKMDTINAEYKKNQFLNELASLQKAHTLLAEQIYADKIVTVVKKLTNNSFGNIFPVSALADTGLESLKECLYHVPKHVERNV